MVTPERRRRAVVVLQERFGVSERRACRVVGQHRSTQRKPCRPRPGEEDKLRRRLRATPGAIPAGAGRWPIACSCGRGGASTASALGACGGRKACAGRLPAESADGGREVNGAGPSTRTMCGLSTSSSTRPPTAGGSSC